MIFSVDVTYEAFNHEAAEAVRREIQTLLDRATIGAVAVSSPAEVMPLVQFEDDDET